MVPGCDLLIRHARVVDGSGEGEREGGVAVTKGAIVSLDAHSGWTAEEMLDADGLVLAPGFIDTHTHDDTSVIEAPAMLPKLTQGVTTVVVGNCGVSASPVLAVNALPAPMGLLGTPASMQYRSFAAYGRAVDPAVPGLNVMALVATRRCAPTTWTGWTGRQRRARSARCARRCRSHWTAVLSA